MSFGELTELEVRDFFFGSVESLEADQLNPGGFVVANKHSVSLINPDLSAEILAGEISVSTIMMMIIRMIIIIIIIIMTMIIMIMIMTITIAIVLK